jgi:hypothetical protein
MSINYTNILNNFGYLFSAVFILEAIIKITAFGYSYFSLNWNKFDFFVVLASIFDIILNNIKS